MNPVVKQIILLTQTKREEQIIFNSAIHYFYLQNTKMEICIQYLILLSYGPTIYKN